MPGPGENEGEGPAATSAARQDLAWRSAPCLLAPIELADGKARAPGSTGTAPYPEGERRRERLPQRVHVWTTAAPTAEGES